MTELCNVNLTYPMVFSNVIIDPITAAENVIVLFTKQFIYKNKCKGQPSTVRNLKTELTLLEKMLSYNAQLNGKKKKHDKIWAHIRVKLW